jgi:hypothetical protein
MSQQPHSGKYPNDTPITQMVSPALAGALAPYERLTKNDLLAMAGLTGQGVTPPEDLGITQQDLRVIKDVFAAEQQVESVEEVTGHLSDITIYVCCCPCSCAVASQTAIRVRPLS